MIGLSLGVFQHCNQFIDVRRRATNGVEIVRYKYATFAAFFCSFANAQNHLQIETVFYELCSDVFFVIDIFHMLVFVYVK